MTRGFRLNWNVRQGFGPMVLAYLAAVMVLGGASSQGGVANGLLQLAGAVLAGWAVVIGPQPSPLDDTRRFGWWVAAVAVLLAAQIIPLPPAIWTLLPGRAAVAQGFVMLGEPVPWMPLGLAPWQAVEAMGWAIPALALYLAMRCAHAPRLTWVAAVAMTVAGGSVLLGLMQKMGGDYYTYGITNYGQGPGVFANANHQGTLALMVLPLGLAAALAGDEAARRRARHGRAVQLWAGSLWARMRKWGPWALVLGWLALGVLINDSLACFALLPVVVGAMVLIARRDWRMQNWVLPGIAAGAVAIVAVVLVGPFGNDLTGHGAVAGISRGAFLRNGLRIIGDVAPVGAGLGSFVQIYPWYEQAAQVGSIYVNHAHNDILELVVDTGVFGLAAMALWCRWLAPVVWRLWRARDSAPAALAASVAVLAVMAHSLADYPLRTAAISGLFAVMVAVLRNGGEDAQPA
ncbi:hypothetical protein GTZ99_00080 [Novosphingobium sp. FSY-8]|uniref:O-antigen ligase-related domain-containing protein n=1 Tax=Novosphingobium ovatum TaxID=1908523 RepID=A0ABW9X8V3_9SPHN|nr:O-antigen ligase family protein [Novosphingobium ovatum]NBC34950.1 hypothetical protein [Novosphingobium ovatum]